MSTSEEKRMAGDYEIMILFLRRCEDADKPYFTVEVRSRKVTQVRGMENKAAPPEVQRFMDIWEQRVLQGRVKAA